MITTLSIKKDFSPLLRLATPLVLTGLMQSSVYFFETLFLARLGVDILAAGALVTWLFNTLAVILFGTLSSINILVSHKHGANDYQGISLVLRDGLLLAIFFAIPAILLFWNMSPIFLLFGQTPAVVLLAKSYLHALSWGILPDFIMLAFLELIIGLGQTRVVMLFTAFTVTLNIFFSYILIFGKLGMPALSIAGAGWGMTISYWLTAILLSAYVLINNKYKKYCQQIFHYTKPSFLIELLRVGFPMGLMYCVEVGFFFVLSLIMGYMSSQLLAANQIVFQYLGIFIGVIFSIAQSITIRMGHLLGAKEIDSAKNAAYAGVIFSAVFMSIIAIFYWRFPLVFISVDFNIHHITNTGVIKDIMVLLFICAIFQIFEAVRIALFGALRALKDTRFTLLISMMSFWGVALPIGYISAIYFHRGGPGLWWGLVISAFVSMFLLGWRFKFKAMKLQ